MPLLKAVKGLSSWSKPCLCQPIRARWGGINTTLNAALEARARAGALLVDYADRSLTAEAFAAYQEYLRVESDLEVRAQAQLHAADIMLRAYGNERVIEEYRKLNAAEPDNMDVIAILGLALYDSGIKSRFPEAARYLHRCHTGFFF